MRRAVRPSFAIALAAGLAACRSGPPLGEPGGEERLVPWLRAGRTTRSEFAQHLGPPQFEFDGGRLAAWRLRADDARPVPQYGEVEVFAVCSLVVAFDAAQVAVRCSWVRQ